MHLCIFILRIQKIEFTRPPTVHIIMTFSQRCLTHMPLIEKVSWTSCKENSLTQHNVSLLFIFSFWVKVHKYSEASD